MSCVRIQQEFKSGKEYWALERKLCHALSNKNKVLPSNKWLFMYML